MPGQRRSMKLGLNIVANGAHAAGWRMPGARVDAAMDIGLWMDIARAAERACFHFMFWADGIAVRSTSTLILEAVRAHVAALVTVEEVELSRAMLVLVERAKAVVEPAGAAGMAAVLAGRLPGSGPVVVLLSGGNVDPLLLTRIIEHGLAAVGRYLSLRVVMRDRPGALAALTAELAALGLNVLSVEHHRWGRTLAPDQVEVLVTVETRNEAQHKQVVEDLAGRGFVVETLL